MTDSIDEGDDIRIEEATTAHTDGLARLVLEFRNEHSRMIGGPGSMSLADAVAEVERNLIAEHRGYFVAIADGPVADRRQLGYRLWGMDDGFIFSRELYVTPGARRSGVAVALIRQLESWLLERGQEIACISCTPHNVAMLQLARSQGYAILNTIEMRKHLTDDNRAAGSTPGTRDSGVPLAPRGTATALELEWKIL